jgi:ubiquinone/menaquinone biosynthesis C-methylase UbiE
VGKASGGQRVRGVGRRALVDRLPHNLEQVTGNWRLSVPQWDELFKDERFRWKKPRQEVVALGHDLKRRGARRVLDLGFGAGRHTIYLAREGLNVCGTDISPRGMEYTRAWLEKEGLHADLQLSDMTVIPYPDQYFDAVISTNVIHHNTLDNIRRCVAEMHRVLVPGGRALVVVQSKRGYRYGRGQQLEPDTFLDDSGPEAGIPHYFFDEAGLRDLFGGFTIVSLTPDEWQEVKDGVHLFHSHWVITVERAACGR